MQNRNDTRPSERRAIPQRSRVARGTLAGLLILSLLIAGCTSPDTGGTADGATFTDGEPPATPPSVPPSTPPIIVGDRYVEPWVKALAMKPASNCDVGKPHSRCVLVDFRITATDSSKDIVLQACESCGLPFTVVTDAGERISGSVVAGKARAVAGFTSEFTVAFRVPDIERILRLDYEGRHMDMPALRPGPTYRDHGKSVTLVAVTNTSDCVAAAGVTWNPGSARTPCTLVELVMDPAPASVRDPQLSLVLPNGSAINPLALYPAETTPRYAFPPIPMGSEVEIMYLGASIQHTVNATIGTATVQAAPAPLTLAELGYRVVPISAVASTTCDLSVNSYGARFCTLLQLRIEAPSERHFDLTPAHLNFSVDESTFSAGGYRVALSEPDKNAVTWNVSIEQQGADAAISIHLRADASPDSTEALVGTLRVRREPLYVFASDQRGSNTPCPEGAPVCNVIEMDRFRPGTEWGEIMFTTRDGTPVTYSGDPSASTGAFHWCDATTTGSGWSGFTTQCMNGPQPEGEIPPQGYEGGYTYAWKYVVVWWTDSSAYAQGLQIRSTATQQVLATLH